MMVDLGQPEMVNEAPALSPSLEGTYPLRYFTTDIVTELALMLGIPSVAASKSLAWTEIIPFLDGEPLTVITLYKFRRLLYISDVGDCNSI